MSILKIKRADGTLATPSVQQWNGSMLINTVANVFTGLTADPDLLWISDYDVAAVTYAQPTWYRAQVPRAPGSTGEPQYDRMQIVENTTLPGNGLRRPTGRAMRVEIRPYYATAGASPADGDVNSQAGGSSRAEVYDRFPRTPATSTHSSNWPDPVGSIRWYGFSVYVPLDFTTSDSNWFTLTQWKGQYGGSPPEALEIDGTHFELGGTKGRKDLGGIGKGTWTRFEIGFRWATDNTGWVNIWKNDVEIVPLDNRITMDTRSGSDPVDPIYLKQGIYRTKGWTVTHVLHFGPMKVGTTRASVLQ